MPISRSGRRPRAAAAIGTVLAVVATSVLVVPTVSAAPVPIADRPSGDGIVTADGLPTAQMDGVAWAQTIVGDTVYVGGKFAQARPAGAAPGVDTTPRGNFLAYNLTTGALDTTFKPSFNGQVTAVAAAPDGKTLYVGGDFTTVDGQPRLRVAAFDLATGQLTPFAPGANHQVNAILPTADTVYLGGDFTQINGLWRIRLAAIKTNGAVTSWNPEADRIVNGLALTPDAKTLVVAGKFEYLNKTDRATGMGAVNAATGATVPWNDGIISFGQSAGFTSLRTDGTMLWATSMNYGAPPGETLHQFEGTVGLNAGDGSIAWMQDCHGDSYDVFPAAQTIYVASHSHDCSTIGSFPDTKPETKFQRATAFTREVTGTLNATKAATYKSWAGQPSPTMLTWLPMLQAGTVTGASQAAWTVTGNDKYVVMGGEFPAVNAEPQQGLVRFAVPSIAPKKQGPREDAASAWQPAGTASNGIARVSIPANWDRDDQQLNYDLMRAGTAKPVATTTAASQFWSRPTVTLIDPSPPANSSVSYTVVARDRDGNTATSAPASVTTGAALAPYPARVVADGPAVYWRLNESSGTTVNDLLGNVKGTTAGGITRGVAGAITGDADRATSTTKPAFGSSGTVTSAATTAAAGPQSSIELWVKTTSANGGLATLSSAASGSGTVYRGLYLSSGKVTFGVLSGSAKKTLQSSGAINDGKYHQVVGTVGAAGATLYVDGVKVADDPTLTQAATPPGAAYWRLSADGGLSSWPGGSSSAVTGTFDEVALYPQALPATAVAEHARLGGVDAPVPNAAPTAAFTSAVQGRSLQVDGSGSSDSDGTIASYRWDWGDGSAAGTGATPTHDYQANGTYQVTLTVTDDKGATGTVTKPVTIDVPNQPPVAALAVQTQQLTVAADASASRDPDGTVASYAWDWGDGSAPSSGAQAEHTYAQPGTYTITVTVTDDAGATGTASKQVTVDRQAKAVASDGFARTVTGGWGSADTGGAWSLAGSASRFSVSAGTGRMTFTAAGTQLAATLAGVQASNVTATVDVTSDKALSAAGFYLSQDIRKVGGSAYRMKVRVAPDGSATLYLVRVVNNAETTLKQAPVSGVDFAPGNPTRMRVSATVANGVTTLAATLWQADQPAPAAPQLTVTDATPELAGPGSTGLVAYLGSSATTVPVQAIWDNYQVTSTD